MGLDNTSITSLDDLIAVSKGVLIELPPFVEGMPFIAKLKRPSLLALIRAGKIPNTLLNAANSLFVNGIDTKSDSALKDFFEILDVICDSCFVQPSYSELKEAGVTLTDEQLMFVFNYTQKGVAALHKFRSQLKNTGADQHESDVLQNPQ